ncbi:hypothetical protein QJS10_CPA02g01551 [Acorus calamus]|uniref:Uncharacterized protein n=1 Tax=Acorus calamus TaxID=4465 RepID=A0AAV9FBL1_ACOCL|nr:hypothetical protein QJS10_CPA02g01551 [Acorus calamus]
MVVVMVKPEDESGKVDMSGMSLDSLLNPPPNLAAITKLDLSNNNLQMIPESLIARLLNVVVLDVHSNQLKSLPNSIGCLSKLRILNASGNLLDSLPKTIEDCKALEELILNFNQLTRLPDTLGFELTNLKKLSVNSNKLICLPYSTSHLTSLRVLDARLNCLRSLPDDLENLTSLHSLNLSQNFHHLRSLPPSLGLLISLVDLDISYNKITHLPDSLGCLGKLESLSVEGNPLVVPPMHVVEQSIDAVRQYLSERLNNGGSSSSKKRSGWFGKLVKCGTFNGPIAGGSVDREGFMSMSDYRSIDGTASHKYMGLFSPRYVGMFSPRRLFSPKHSSSSSSLAR